MVAPIAVLVFVMAVAVASASNPLAPPVPSQPVTWQAHAGAQTGDQAIQALAFFPTDVFVNVGDTIT
ncbi:MAG: hypothetical protein JOY61_06865, partial [Chloroflexi bacterium]|nr:hypothetical protein [Chloroflexota bacterium]